MQRSIKLTEEQLDRLKFIEGSGLLVRPGNYYNIHFVNGDTYSKIYKMFTAYTDISSIPKDAKGFILPKNNLKKDDIKEICKRYDLKITTDISKADFFIGNDHVSAYCSMYDYTVDSRALMCQAYINLFDYEHCGPKIKNEFINFMSSLAGITPDLLNEQTSIAYTKEINTRYEDWTMYATEGKSNYITDEGIYILYNMLSRKVPVVSVDSLFKGIDKVTIDKDIYDTLVMMFKGTDDDKAVAINMLYNCNIDASLYYIWKLINDLSYVIVYYKHRNTKAHKTFMESIMKLQHLDNIEAIALFKEKNCLTKEIYEDLSRKILNRVNSYGIIEETKRNNVLNISIDIIPYEIFMEITKPEEVDV